ncbi:unnamed protein product [Paramecium primaurelia]|uniref:Uncharacterized protein n=1 Tax=Paramecium primaurelia TaxID=5886 RepID=A0A8S1KW44_PARPR|nr:unnamed protein product [Paramecium primaurelia]CAD8058095.1 unnamed protein product [Paramecium primaurelia]
MGGQPSLSPQSNQYQVDKLKLDQIAIKKRTSKPNLFTTYRTLVIISIIVGIIIIAVLSFNKQIKRIHYHQLIRNQFSQFSRISLYFRTQ